MICSIQKIDFYYKNFLRDRDIDYEILVYNNGIIKYTTRKNIWNCTLYYGLNRGTIIITDKNT